MKDNYKYVVYATSNYGEGRVMKIGEYKDVEEIDIQIGLFSKDVVINIEYQKDEREV